ncbi:hypothetical protein L618_001300001230 [Rhodococcus rhodochrous J45]|uniref:Uncharacterized protein n=1 Tax=Rhodococcus rhodochrous J45 TaxID=935266 RepID=A0A562ENI2_RHORH|nr:hypothetical protein [Rhodococcus rhodochrous]TWH23288.1 hypothetical protein L618_001300001230 [Rhodococcus rhodochrous J45]
MTPVPGQRDLVAALAEAHSRYPTLEGGSFYDEVLLEVQARTERDGAIGKADIGGLMLWKRLNLSTAWTRELNEWPDRKVRAITAEAFELARDTDRTIPEAAQAARSALLELPGCQRGAAVASTVLTAGAPDRMAVYDRRAVAALVGLGFPDPDGYYSRYMAAVCELVVKVNVMTGGWWNPRDVDKALFVLGG